MPGISNIQNLKSKMSLRNVLIKRIAICRHPAVGDSEMVLMKSAQADDELQSFVGNLGDRLLGWIQQRLEKHHNPQSENNDMDLSKLTIDDLQKARPDLVEDAARLSKTNTPDPFAAVKARLEEIANGMKSLAERVTKIEKTEPAAPVSLQPLEEAVTGIRKTVEDLGGKVETLARASSRRLAHGEEEPVQKSAFAGALKSLRKSNPAR